MSDEPNYITPAGYKKLTDEVEFLLKKERPRVVQEVADAAAQGDRSENAEYIYGKKRLREIDRRLNFLSSRLKNVQVVDPATPRGDSVYFGATVDLEDEEGRKVTWQIVGVDETDPSNGRISWRSPLGRALLKKRADDVVTFQKPGGDAMEYTVLAVRYV
ncbi:MAG: transcription elongation factor GreB [Polyangiales bacterium]